LHLDQHRVVRRFGVDGDGEGGETAGERAAKRRSCRRLPRLRSPAGVFDEAATRQVALEVL
jgi:hypothetical protein